MPDVRMHLKHYGLAVVSVAVALGAALLLQELHFRDAAVPLLLFAGAITAWYGGPGPAVLAVILSLMSFAYFFVPPIHSLYVESRELPYFMIFASFASLISWFATIRRRVEEDLRRTHDKLKVEIAERTQQAELLNLTHDSIFVRDLSDVITYWNRGAEELYGFAAQEAIGRPSHQLLRTAFPSPLAEINRELLRTAQWEGELKHTKSNGTEVVVSSRWSLRRDQQDRPVAVLETNNDITARKSREKQIQELNEELGKRAIELESTNKELEAFAYSISHDLRAPLRHMAGFAELLRKSAAATLNEKSAHYVTMILEAANRMGALIDDLLAFSRISRTEAHNSMVDLGQLVQEAVAEVRQDAAGRKIAWKVSRLPTWYGDRPMLRLALVNLISNAVKFTRTKPQAEIEIGCTEHKNDKVVLFVRDNGVGFDMKYSNKLFGVFQRLHAQEVFEGTGIGLATVQRIVHRHGGRVWAEGIVEGGAAFYFSLGKIKGAN
ncbi:MAG TPA: ATP-binding protein [Bryobacteraceae bacterium]|nr:ATP-binding protein [Bryobacteraceae bacterium]